MADPVAAPSQHPILANLTVLGVGLFLALAFGECALRIYNPVPLPLRGQTQVLPKSLVIERKVPYPKDGKLLEQFTVRTNALGFRGPEHPGDPEQHLELFFVGGSTTEGHYIDDAHAWPLVATATLAAEFPNVWGTNAGLEGNTTIGHRLLLERVILPLKPDYVVLLVGLNDMFTDELKEHDEGTAKGLFWKNLEFSELLSTAAVLYRSMRAHDAGLVVFTGLHLDTKPRHAIEPEGIEAALKAHRDRGGPSGYEGRLRELVTVVRAAGAEPVFVTQPALVGTGVDPTTGQELGPIVGEGTWNPAGTGEYGALRWALLEMYNDVTRKVAAETGVPLVELARTLPKDSAYYVDWVHYSNAGAAKVGEIVGRGLRPVLRARAERR